MRTPLPTLLARIALRPAHLSRTATFSPLPLSSNNKFVITRTMSAASASTSTSRGRSPTRVPGPVETTIQQKVIEAFNPVLLRVYNDSHKHAHHAAMRAQGGGSGETHFAIHLVSESFKGKTAIARHRMVNALLKPEFDERGLHALSLRLKTPEEWEKEGGGEMR
ncbi:hypothetical protein CNBG_5654 [Cryptococcus deuterogattii R265]|uniref:BolA protein n=1 Tax=Cryptococcus deuterogattii (strain R265) TaxID=294750 RepID=A0A095DGI2_CRYD2|nr:hypothetical protein CNBG_5654 [Cryptococcus deuterogattii R265]KIR33013.1 hypothetical protein I352_04379 [Cryptococcus deuterogattii MMRL2647]KIR72466.1 hypothetical protein I310_03873 [Cryptococcus deuterogattii CA1014]KIR97871.1 hypothetical protein L804_05018 [Cryptococcus deuterogattii 2001/935-1]